VKLAELAKAVGGEARGDAEREIRGVAQAGDVRDDEATFVDDPKYLPLLARRDPAAVFVRAFLPELRAPQIVVAEPRFAAIQASAAFVADPVFAPGVDPRAVVEPGAVVDPTATVMALAYVGAGATVGPHAVLAPQVYVGPEATIGANAALHTGVRVGARCRIGARVVCWHNVSIGADGFGFVRIGDQHVKIPQKGAVVVEDDVEIGANTCIDRATFGRTVIGAGTKIDNLVQIGHNCLIGKRVLIVAQVGLSGSVTVGDDAVLAAASGVVPHVRIGRGSVVGAKSGVHKDVPDGAMVAGYPAKDHMAWKRETAALKHLPEAIRALQRLEKRVEELETKDLDT
jgi:UDP-3-O-[3-hydroxymyristoyl] glucosamine N-acyltransferase